MTDQGIAALVVLVADAPVSPERRKAPREGCKVSNSALSPDQRIQPGGVGCSGSNYGHPTAALGGEQTIVRTRRSRFSTSTRLLERLTAVPNSRRSSSGLADCYAPLPICGRHVPPESGQPVVRWWLPGSRTA